jgi:type I site-specific restriction-modification system R (restriction) subunit
MCSLRPSKQFLRHARVETTQHHYVILEKTKSGDAAMRKLERAVAKHAANMQRRFS